MADSESVRILDASSAHRITDQWVYGLPEISLAQKSAIKNVRWVSNPGCYPTGAILLLRPLIEAGLLSPVYPYAINAVSGYTGGGREAIERFENTEHAVLCAVYDNLGKGASGAAVQNLEIMLGLPESDGLVSAAL